MWFKQYPRSADTFLIRHAFRLDELRELDASSIADDAQLRARAVPAAARARFACATSL
jgi:hypothetical protein